MKRLLIVTAFAALAGCTAPTAPTQEPIKPIAPAQHDNIPATFAGHPEGPVVWLCATQPRQVITVSATGQSSTWEEDHYLQYEPCPAVPIK